MTLHKDMAEKRSTDELGNLIQWALRERVAGASPPPEVWERIHARIEQSTVRGPALSANGAFGVEGRVGPDRGGYRAAMKQLSRGFLWGLSKVNAFLSAQTVRVWHQNEWKEWRSDPDYTHLLVDQYGFQLVLAF
ncbi:MAG: hypothetical protein V3S14_07375 [Anaerolineae bacterium]